MAQFDVHANPGRQVAAIPYIVVVQNDRFDRARGRLVVPLILRTAVPIEEHCMAPLFRVEGRDVWLDVFNMATVPAGRLGAAVASLGADADRARIVRAIDELVSQA